MAQPIYQMSKSFSGVTKAAILEGEGHVGVTLMEQGQVSGVLFVTFPGRAIQQQLPMSKCGLGAKMLKFYVNI